MSKVNPENIASVIRTANGKIVGRTRLQKIVYLLEAVGCGFGFDFAYKHYGPYSESVADSALIGDMLGYFSEEEHVAQWGGVYSIFTCSDSSVQVLDGSPRELINIAANADSIALELAATAVFLSREGFTNPWEETIRRKPEKASDDRLQKAKSLLADLSSQEYPNRLPELAG